MALSLFVFVAILAACAVGQLNIPVCASACLASGLVASGCSISGASCYCLSNDFVASYACCISSSCDPADENSGVTLLQSMCRGSMVTVTASCNGSVAMPSTAAVSLSAGSTISLTGSTVQGTPTTNSPTITTTAPIFVASLTTQLASTVLPNSNIPQSSITGPSTGLSIGAKVGIPIGVVAIVLIAAITLLLFLRQRRKKSGVIKEDQIDDKLTKEPKSSTGANILELEGSGATASQKNPLIDSGPTIHELAG